MTEQEQIEELAKYICNACEMGNCFDGECASLMGRDYKTCFITIETAKHIYKAGYRKQSEVAKEIFDDLENTLEDCTVIGTSNVGYFQSFKFEQKLAELKKKYTEEQK